jgi:hypothetical protein
LAAALPARTPAVHGSDSVVAESVGFDTLYPTKKSLRALEIPGLKKIYPPE